MTNREYCIICEKFIDLGDHRIDLVKRSIMVVTEFGLPDVTHILLRGARRLQKLSEEQ